jgi:hypothetical protein
VSPSISAFGSEFLLPLGPATNEVSCTDTNPPTRYRAGRSAATTSEPRVLWPLASSASSGGPLSAECSSTQTSSAILSRGSSSNSLCANSLWLEAKWFFTGDLLPTEGLMRLDFSFDSPLICGFGLNLIGTIQVYVPRHPIYSACRNTLSKNSIDRSTHLPDHAPSQS